MASPGTQGLRQKWVQGPALTPEHNMKNHLLQNLASGWGSWAVRANLSSVSLWEMEREIHTIKHGAESLGAVVALDHLAYWALLHSWSHWRCAVQGAVESGSQEWEMLNDQMNLSHIKPFCVAVNEVNFPCMELSPALPCHLAALFPLCWSLSECPRSIWNTKTRSTLTSQQIQSWPVVGQEIKKLTLSSPECDTISASWEEIYPIRLNHCLST